MLVTLTHFLLVSIPLKTTFYIMILLKYSLICLSVAFCDCRGEAGFIEEGKASGEWESEDFCPAKRKTSAHKFGVIFFILELFILELFSSSPCTSCPTAGTKKKSAKTWM